MFTLKWPTTSRLLLIAVGMAAVLLVLWPRMEAKAVPSAQQPIPHSVEDHADCVACHATGLAGAPAFPADHTGRTNAQCIACHSQPSSPAAPAAPAATSEVPAAPAEPTAISEVTATAQSNASTLDNWSSKSCQACHPREWSDWSRSGHAMTLSAQLLNSEHNSSELLDQTCLKCHSPELGTEKIENIVQPVDTKGPWHLVGQYANAGDLPAISCLACHQPHTERSADQKPTGDFGDESTFFRGVTAPQVTNLFIFDAAAQKHVDPAPIAPVMNGNQPLPITQSRANGLCYTCHATERAESNLFEVDKPPEGDNGVGTGDDRTLTGAHQGLQCVTCHMPGGSHTFNPMNSCGQCHGSGTTTTASLDYVTQVRTSYTDPSLSMLSGNASPLNIHWLDKTQLWPPVIVAMTATDDGDTVTYSISIRNFAAWDLSNITVKGSVPAGAKYLESWVINRNNPGTFDGTGASFTVTSIVAGKTFEPITYRVLKGTATDFAAHAWISWGAEIPGSATSPNATITK